MRGNRLLGVAFAVFAVGLGAAAVALDRYRDAGAWVTHTSDVRLVLGRAIGHAANASSCDDLERDIRELAELTADNPDQAPRVAALRAAVGHRCTTDGSGGDDREVLQQLVAADETERDLMRTRRDRLGGATLGAVAAFVAAMLAVLVIVVIAVMLQRRAIWQLMYSEERFRHLAAHASDLVRLHEPSGKTIYASPSCQGLLGYTPEEMMAVAPITDLCHPDEVDTLRGVLADIVRGDDPAPRTYRLLAKSGEYRWFESSYKAVRDSAGALVSFYTASRDVTARVAAERQLEALAVTDELTGLHNRRGFTMLAGQAHRVALRQGHPVAVVFADLDGLKPINDRLGHDVGDRAIAELGELLRATFRDSDVVARLGGDEFAVLAYAVARPQVDGLIARLRAVIAERNGAPGRVYTLSVSLGVAVLEAGERRTLDELIAEADAQMYDNKRAGRDPGRSRAG